MRRLPRRSFLVPLLGGMLLLVLSTAALCGDSGAKGADEDRTPPAETATPEVTPAVSPEPTEPLPTPAGPTPEGGAGGLYPCDRSGPGSNISVESPEPGDTVSSPVTVRGTASVFEATLQVVIRRENGEQIAGQTVMASEGAPGTGTYEAAIEFELPSGPERGCIEVYNSSPRDGSPQNVVSIPVELTP